MTSGLSDIYQSRRFDISFSERKFLIEAHMGIIWDVTPKLKLKK